MSRLRVGTRGSTLALTQARGVAALLEARAPGLSVEIVEIRTAGDRIRDVPLGPHLGQAFFTKEIQDALLAGRVDVAVHSCKDLAASVPPGLALGAIPEREDPRDAIVSPLGGLRDLPGGARVGTSSPRRKLFLAAARSDLDVRDQRGNVPTRVAAVDDGVYDAVVLAVAGLRRLGLAGRIAEILDYDTMLPAAGQGALAVEVRAEDAATREVVSVLDDPVARAEVNAERSCLRRLEAGCQAPVGASGRVEGGVVRLRAAVAGPGGIVRAEAGGPVAGAEALGLRVAEGLLEQLGVATLRGAPWWAPSPGSRGTR